VAEAVSSRRRLGAPRAGVEDAAPYGWAPAVVLFFVGLVDRVEIGLLAGVLPLIQREWGFGDTAAGSIPTAAALAAVLATLPAGYIADRYDRTRVIALVVFCWALLTLGSGLATGFALFYAIRVVLALSESFYTPVSASLLADFYPPKTRPKAYGWVRISANLGGLGTLLGGVLGQTLGWRAPFLVVVLPGVLVAWMCWRVTEPPRGKLDGPTAAGPARGSLRAVLRIPTLVTVAFSLMALSFGLFGSFYWMPSLIHRSYGVDEGGAAAVAGATTAIGVLIGTACGAWLGRRWYQARKAAWLLIGGGGITVGTVVLAAGLATNALLPLAVSLVLATAFMAMATPTLTAAIAAVVGAASRGVGFAAVQVLAAVGTALGPLVIGVVSDWTGSLKLGMAILLAPMLAGGLVTLAARRFFDRDVARALDV
jgi:predicted MFS family arabinose efflux permease